jgi:plasmid stabilization system protein ParE
MKFTVVWLPSALRQLAHLWNNGPDRAAITAAANAIDYELAHDPESKGESRSGGTRILPIPPLAVYFDVREQDRLVSVSAVWRIKKQP